MDNNPEVDEDPWTDDLPLPPGYWRSRRGNIHDEHGEYANDIQCRFLDDDFGPCIPHPEDGMMEDDNGVEEEEEPLPDVPSKCEYKYSFETTTEFLDDVKSDMTNLNKKYGIPKIDKLQHIWSNEKSLRDWLLQEHPDILKSQHSCHECGSEKLWLDGKNRYICQRCKKEGASSVRGAWRNSFFDGCKRGKHDLMKFLYYWLSGATTKQIGIYTGWSKSKVIEWTKKVQALIAYVVSTDHQMIGGPGIVVEIDESKFGKRKYNKGKRVEGAWVFGGVELTPERRFFCMAVEDRKASTLIPIIKSHIAPGSIIRSDCWKAYDIINFQEGYDYVHEKVNHSETYRSDEGVDTNTIEGTWAGVKRMVPARKRTKKQLPGCLFEFIWRRRNEGNLWNGLLRALEEVYYDDD